jgi:SAM-dependent methyltransferase
MLISEDYREQNRLLHEQREDYGRSSKKWAPYVDHLVREERHDTVLDYGCGKGLLAQELAPRGIRVAEYDPSIPGKEATPEPADLVACTDVLEHIEPAMVNAVIRDLRRVTKRKLFFSISTVPASKMLPDGRNAHLIVKPAEWWRKKLAPHFHIAMWVVEPAGLVYGLAAPNTGVKYVKPTQRRRLTPIMVNWLEQWRRDINKYSDAFSKIETIRMWEGVEDEIADVQVASDILENMPDPDVALRDIVKNSLRGTIITLKLTEQRDEKFWKTLLEKRFRFAQWQVEHGHALMVGAPMVSVQGVTAIGAVESETRWTQTKAAAQRIAKRIETKPAHGRRAIIACYGPSLVDTIEQLKKHAAEPNTDVFSVSGSHDFLIEHGIVPFAHIECDPRPHKTDNLAKPHPGVKYLIASTCHENYFDKLEAHGADIHLWHVSTPEHAVRIVDELKESKECVISGGGSVGLRSIPLLYALGYRDYSFFAMDCSFKLPADVQGRLEELLRCEHKDPERLKAVQDDALATVRQWAGKHAGKKQALVEVVCNGRLFIASPILLTYATNFFETVQKAPDIGIRLYGDGLLQSMANWYMAESETIVPQLERPKKEAA